MPIYEYRCEACGEEHEALQKMSEPPLRICPRCGEDRLRKQLTAPGFQLKGSGWYETDFKDNGKEKKKDTEKSESKKDTGASKTATKESTAKTSDNTSSA